MEHEFSGYTVSGMRKALEKLGYLDELKPALKPASLEALANGGLFKFQKGSDISDVLVTLARLKGNDAVAALMEEVTRSSLDGIVAPLARMYLTLKGNEPSVLFERFNDLLRGTARGITAKWTATGPREGRIVFSYLAQIDPVVAHGWRGALGYVLTFCHARGEVTVEPPPPDGHSVSLKIAWSPPRAA